MKLNKYILGLLIAPALAFAGCSDYEDTEIVSPQADETAIGANFSAASTSVVMHPDKTSFTLTLNRVNTKGAASIPVTVASCDEVSTGVKFCDQPTKFEFADGEATAKVTLNVNASCLFQKTYKMALTIGEKKDHPYASGTTSTLVSFTKDYTWERLGQPVILEGENNYWVGPNAGILAPVEWASDYENDNGNMLFRIKALYAYAGKGTDTTTGHLQFFLDKNYNPATLFSTNGYDPANINTGVQQNAATEENKVYYKLDFTGVSGGTYKDEVEDGETVKVLSAPYVFSYKVFYASGQPEISVEATLDFDILNATEAIKAEE